MTTEQTLIEQLLARKTRLYELYVKPLEAEHLGKWAAVSFDGDVILAEREGEAMRYGSETFGHGNYEALRVGYDVVQDWVSLW